MARNPDKQTGQTQQIEDSDRSRDIINRKDDGQVGQRDEDRDESERIKREKQG
jgi:hypothetical protein